MQIANCETELNQSEHLQYSYQYWTDQNKKIDYSAVQYKIKSKLDQAQRVETSAFCRLPVTQYQIRLSDISEF